MSKRDEGSSLPSNNRESYKGRSLSPLTLVSLAGGRMTKKDKKLKGIQRHYALMLVDRCVTTFMEDFTRLFVAPTLILCVRQFSGGGKGYYK